MAQSYIDLVAWKKSMQLVREIYQVSKEFPKDETYGLTSQMRRAAVSIPCNIAEGKGRWSQRDFQRFLIQARGSVFELETQLLIARDLGYAPEERTSELLDQTSDVGRTISGLISALRRAAAVG